MTVKSTISARVISNKPLQKGRAGKYFRMALALDKPIKKVIPGQFVHIKLDSQEHFAAQAGEVTARLSQRLNASEHILPRPFTIYSAQGGSASGGDAGNKIRVIEVVYQVVGKGTELMSHLRPSNKVRVLCPLGNGFRIDKKARMSILVAGGIGLAGLYLLLKELVASEKCHCEPAGRGNLKTGQRDCFADARNDTVGKGSNIILFIGARSKNDLCLLPEFRKLTKDIVVSTEDGSLGTKGLITAALDKFLNNSALRIPYSALALYSCGPRGMSEAVRQIAVAKNIPAQLSLEARMGCGVGLCRVCVCKTVKGYGTVCEDGPVFSAQDLA